MKQPKGCLMRYALASTDEQEIELRAAGCAPIMLLGTQFQRLARTPSPRTLVMRLDCLARLVSHLLKVIENLARKGAHFRSLRDPIDTSTPQGMFSLQVLGAELERALISEQTKAGTRAAKSKGKFSGNPGVREKRPDALARMTAAQKAAYSDRIQASANQ